MSIHRRALLLSLLCCGPAVSAQQHALRLQLRPDTTLRYVATTEMVMNMTLPRKLDTQMRIDIYFDLQVGKPEKDGKTPVTTTVRRLKIKVDNPPLSKIDYDSEQKDSDAGMLGELKALLGKAFAMQMDARGHLSDVQLPKDFPPRAANLFGGDMGQFFADNFPELPENPVATGDQWQTQTAMPLRQSGSTTITVDNRLDAVQEQRAAVQQTLHVDLQKLELPTDVVVEVPLAEGKYVLDLQSGAVAEVTTTMDVHTKGKQNGMPVDMRQHLVRSLRQLLQDPSAPLRPGEAR